MARQQQVWLLAAAIIGTFVVAITIVWLLSAVRVRVETNTAPQSPRQPIVIYSLTPTAR